jgi:glycosyltransferase involved in cell wall biosynthesis
MSGTVAIPVGVDPAVLRGGDGNVARERLRLSTEPIILSIGHVIPQRSRIALAKALPEILRQVPDAKLVVIGGLYHDEFLRIASELGVADSIIALGALPQREIPDFLAAADLEVHELEGEGFGTASLEALAVGIPVVAAVRPDNFLDLAMSDGRELFLAPFFSDSDERADPRGLAEVIVRVLADPVGARQQVSANARRFVEENFTIERVAQAHLETLAELIAANHRPKRR